MRTLRRTLSLLLAVALSVSIAMAQPGTGILRGTMTDDSGAVIPAAKISLSGKGVAKTAQTQADGSYVFAGLAPGQYTVKAVLPGFATTVAELWADVEDAAAEGMTDPAGDGE